MSEALQILQKYWKHERFREPQEEIIQSVLNGNDTFALLPTGGGKSVCFQIPAMMLNGICLVISPLIALMKDQVQNLQSKNIKAIALTGGVSQDEVIDILDNCQFGNYKFLYLSPERLQHDWIVERLKQLPINLIAIDEAHCVSQWGHDFRPAYLKISALKTHFPSTPFLALTATANKRVQEDICNHLAFVNPKVFTKSFTRENLAYHVIKTEDKLFKIRQILTKNPQSSIIYVRNRKSCIETSQQLNQLGFTCTFYHGGLPAKEKEKNMQSWLENKSQVMVATNAFGMGIDKPDVKTVIHIQLPENIENYYQEAGRAGRNGEKAFGIILTNATDINYTKAQFIDVLPDKKFVRDVYVKLNNYFQIAYGEGYNESFAFNLNQFCAQYQFPIIKTFNSLQFLDRQGILTFQNESSEKINLQFIIPSKEVIRYISLHPHDETVITTILRTYSGIFEVETTINPHLVAKKSQCTESQVEQVIDKLAKSNCIILHAKNNDSYITFNEAREDDLTINRVAKFLEHQNNLKQEQFQSVVNYISNEDTCKNKMLLAYFDEVTKEDCGICSYCFSKNKDNPIATTQLVIELLKKEALSSREIESKLNISSEATIFALQLLLENNKIALNSNNQYYLL
ncbi:MULTISPECIES: ATP-dependent DNA helicase RecQ [unclassified Flavobacterium]|uniref:RecQ family ATP-dependent DNA helicase n=1 Tax=unclassified Flavobacterium TaxID=196869 RepID=UPI0012924C5D|nr:MULTISPECIES: ATP-dependent DNA helicase RecQ [unclassified Flavobacterium]MQP53138.1 RecQ family ATP-dependent DNA helicase [Flavobacterium sp. LMO9]MQP62779.1 RecQ family ATP-dependent DNA helicase [Flavobacterium sp. LMO6]